MTPEEFDQLAKSLHHSWESPQLWPSIERKLRAPRRARLAWLAAAGIAAALLIAALLPRSARQTPQVRPNDPLLTEQALADVQAAEAAYRRSIDALALVAEPKLENPGTPLQQVYAEKLRLLDGAIAELRQEIDRNGFNAHLHMQMAVLYRDKQRTLEQVLNYD